jgi:hypothetical protein
MGNKVSTFTEEQLDAYQVWFYDEIHSKASD